MGETVYLKKFGKFKKYLSRIRSLKTMILVFNILSCTDIHLVLTLTEVNLPRDGKVALRNREVVSVFKMPGSAV